MPKNQQRENRSKKAKTNSPARKKQGEVSAATQRQAERENQPGRGSGEGKSGLQRGDGHPTGR
jgi:hypothetical protein